MSGSTGDSRIRRLEQICARAEHLHGSAREAYLDQNCSDPQLRHEVEVLLAATVAHPGPVQTGAGHAASVPLDEFPKGSMLAHYRLQKKLGSGGMGWVYEAVDEVLGRTVAIKVLPPGRIDENLRKRFEREAKSTSSLNHPNIVTIYEIGREGDVDFIVMERIDGVTLSNKIPSTGMEPVTALRYASQVADALAAAHDAGVVHRDLKPHNVMVTERGSVKVLDFGIAKTGVAIEAPDRPPAEAETLTGGILVGTPAYMSPEQALGKRVDIRSDVFAFGSLLFEMLTGKRAFTDGNPVATMAAIVYRHPDLTLLPPELPANIATILRRCFEKEPASRWRHMSDVRALLEEALRGLEPATGAHHIAAGPAPRRRGWLTAALAFAAGAALTFGVMHWRAKGSNAPRGEPVLRRITAESGLATAPAISPDGKLVAFASDRAGEGNLDIWLHQTGGLDPIRLTRDAADETDPSFSPDGTRLAFRSERTGGGVYTIPTLGGNPVLLAAGGRNPRFSPDGKRVAYWTGGEGVYHPGSSHVWVIDAAGGHPVAIQPSMASATYPVWSPRGDALMALGRRDAAGAPDATLDWWILPLDGTQPRATGILGQIMRQKLRKPGWFPRIYPAALDWQDRAGSKLAFSAPLGDAAQLWEISLRDPGVADGSARRLTSGPGLHLNASRAAAAGTEWIAFSDEELNFDIWGIHIDAERGVTKGELMKLTSSGMEEWSPSITADGRKVAYLSRRVGSTALIVRDMATSSEHTLLSGTAYLGSARIAGNGSRVFYGTGYDLFAMTLEGGAAEKICEKCGAAMGASRDGRRLLFEPIQFEDLMQVESSTHKVTRLASRPAEKLILSSGQFSPDGQWAAFHALDNATSTARIWIAKLGNAPAPPGQWIAVTDGTRLERDPYWSPGGSLIYFISERDGFRCIWARAIHRETKQPSGEAFAVQHFHTARRSLRRFRNLGTLTGLSVGGDLMVFSLGELTGNIWLQETRNDE